MTDPRLTDRNSTRDRLLQLLRYRACTVDELAGEVGLTFNGVRSQLAVLERDGLVRRSGVRHAESPGKPPLLYAITDRAEAQFSAAYEPVLAGLIAALTRRLDASALHATFEEAGRGLAINHGSPSPKEAGARALALLTSLGAAATLRRENGRDIVEGAACPLATVVRRCPDSCEMVRSMVAASIGANVTTECSHGAAPRCRFSIE